ncbi:MAG TPA: hypothetical protein VH188_03680 [Chthoniobacterales bacterium]|nr:hypothetical protein [Chthoniobacterales bacterium]
MKRFLVAAVLIAFAVVAFPAARSAASRPDTDENDNRTVLNKHKLACLAVAIHEMERHGWSFRNYQVVIWDMGSYYDIGFMEDPLNLAITGGPGHSWHIRKRDHKVIGGPWAYR